jgi:hypothetical protein
MTKSKNFWEQHKNATRDLTENLKIFELLGVVPYYNSVEITVEQYQKFLKIKEILNNETI